MQSFDEAKQTSMNSMMDVRNVMGLPNAFNGLYCIMVDWGRVEYIEIEGKKLTKNNSELSIKNNWGKLDVMTLIPSWNTGKRLIVSAHFKEGYDEKIWLYQYGNVFYKIEGKFDYKEAGISEYSTLWIDRYNTHVTANDPSAKYSALSGSGLAGDITNIISELLGDLDGESNREISKLLINLTKMEQGSSCSTGQKIAIKRKVRHDISNHEDVLTRLERLLDSYVKANARESWKMHNSLHNSAFFEKANDKFSGERETPDLSCKNPFTFG